MAKCWSSLFTRYKLTNNFKLIWTNMNLNFSYAVFVSRISINIVTNKIITGSIEHSVQNSVSYNGNILKLNDASALNYLSYDVLNVRCQLMFHQHKSKPSASTRRTRL